MTFKEAFKEFLKHIPKEWENTEIQVTGGGELIADHIAGKHTRVKVERCNHCGLCCVDFPGTHYGDDDEGRCNALVPEGDGWICSKWTERPKNCVADPEEGEIPLCSIRYDK